MVTEKDTRVSRIYPNLKYIREVSIKIALAIGKHCYELIDVTYEWPANDMKHGFPVPVVRRESVDE
ncbi:unnamed protein product [Gongylonema pulchrum]|uniref:Integrase n=1 Tax=Gongylonema pulchrum TaxID=637853 RepID=A0A183CVM2_9BILA|nr:unnamed protein product [Gongylonema pulchrum]